MDGINGLRDRVSRTRGNDRADFTAQLLSRASTRRSRRRRAYSPGAREMVGISVLVIVRLDWLLSGEYRISLE